MRIIQVSFCVFVSLNLSFAQTAPPISKTYAADSTQNEFDSLSHRMKSGFAPVNTSFQNSNDKIKSFSNSSSLKNKITTINSLDQVKNFSPAKFEDRYKRKFDLLQRKIDRRLWKNYTSRKCSFREFQRSNILRRKADSIERTNPTKQIQSAEKKLNQLQSNFDHKIKIWTSKITQINKSDAEKFDLRPVDFSTSSLTQTKSIPTVSQVNLSKFAPSLNFGKGGLFDSTNSLSSKMPSSNYMSKYNFSGKLSSDFSRYENLPSLTKDEKLFSNSTSMLSINEKKISAINENTIESQVENAEMFKKLTSQELELEKYKKTLATWQSDPDYKKELALMASKEQALNPFEGKEKELTAGISKMKGIKSKYKGVEGTLDIFKKPANPMKVKPFVERLSPGFNIQYQSKVDQLIDFNPQIAYKISGRLSAGLGWDQRWGFNLKKRNYNSGDNIYGARAFGQVNIKSGVYAMIAPEYVSALVPPNFNSNDPSYRKWLWNWMVGMKKEFRYSGNMLGNLQMLYNFYDPRHQSPYVSKLSVRMGFEFELKKRAKR